MVLTGCAPEKVDVGTNWLSGIEVPNINSGKIGDFYLDTDDMSIYQKDSQGFKGQNKPFRRASA